MEIESRRSFNQKLLGSVTAFSLIETLFCHDLFADEVKPVINQWALRLQELGQDLKTHKLTDVEFQTQLEELYKRVSLPELIKLVQLDRLTNGLKYPESGAASLGFELGQVQGLPRRPAFGRQIFALGKGRSIVPHGHDNMCTGFIILRGNFVGKHYDRVEDREDHYLIRPTIDRSFDPGDCSTISDHKDNVHWFKAESDRACIFNIHVFGYNPDNKNPIARVYVDPQGEKVSGGLIVAKKMTSKACHKKYG